MMPQLLYGAVYLSSPISTRQLNNDFNGTVNGFQFFNWFGIVQPANLAVRLHVDLRGP